MRSERGVSLVEIVVAMVLSSMVLSAIAALYQAALKAQDDALAQIPLAQAASAASTFVRNRLQEATCLQLPAPGASAGMMLGAYGRDCAGAAVPGETPEAFVLCIDAAGRLAYNRRPQDQATGDFTTCDTGADDWIILHSPAVTASAQPGLSVFTRSSGRQNQVFMAVRFVSVKDKAAPVDWRTTAVIAGPIDPPL